MEPWPRKSYTHWELRYARFFTKLFQSRKDKAPNGWDLYASIAINDCDSAMPSTQLSKSTKHQLCYRRRVLAATKSDEPGDVRTLIFGLDCVDSVTSD